MRIEIIDQIKSSSNEDIGLQSKATYVTAYILSDFVSDDELPNIRAVNQLIANATIVPPYLLIDQTDPRISIASNILTFTPDIAFQTTFGVIPVRMRALISNGTGTDDTTFVASENYSYSSPGVVSTIYMTDFYATTFKLIFTL